jgi:mono/diheme cytochrome c family protein
MLKPFLIVSAVALLVFAAASLPGPAQQGSAASLKDSTKLSDKALARSKEIYSVDCALCHGETGDGKTDLAKGMELVLDDWTDPKSLAGKPDEALFNVIRNGKGKMPSEDVGRAKDDEVRNLIVYIRGFASQQPAAAPAPSN